MPTSPGRLLVPELPIGTRLAHFMHLQQLAKRRMTSGQCGLAAGFVTFSRPLYTAEMAHSRRIIHQLPSYHPGDLASLSAAGERWAVRCVATPATRCREEGITLEGSGMFV